jgi:ribosomal protein S18 acetylase RimI-like enzyme
MEIRPLRFPDEVAELQTLVAICHPTRKARDDDWWFVHPTIVAVQDTALVGYATLIINPLTKILTLMDCGVAPEARGQHLGWRLMEYRLELGREYGCQFIAGAVAPDNGPMRRIAVRAGLQEALLVPDYYSAEDSHATSGIILVGKLENVT